MFRFIRIVFRLVVAAMIFQLAACTQIARVEFDKASAPPIRKIALLQVPESQHITLRNIGGAADVLVGGAIGAVIAGDINHQNAKRFLQEIESHNYKSGPVMASQVQRLLTNQGYAVDYLDKQRPVVIDGGRGVDYANIQTDADAILDIWFGITGYVSPKLSKEYEPWIVVFARLVDAQTKRVLYYHAFSAGFDAGTHNIDNISLGDDFRFQSVDAVIGNFEKASKGITVGHQKIAAVLAGQLKK